MRAVRNDSLAQAARKLARSPERATVKTVARPKDRDWMTNSTVLIADMGILVGIFLLGLLAKLFAKIRDQVRDRASGAELPLLCGLQ